MPGKLKSLPGRRGKYYKRKFPASYKGHNKVLYKGRTYQRYSRAVDNKRHAKRQPRRAGDVHTGDYGPWL
jgi:hypothetical protein